MVMKVIVITLLLACGFAAAIAQATETGAADNEFGIPERFHGHSVLRFTDLDGNQLAYMFDLIAKLDLDVWAEPSHLNPYLDVRVAPHQMEHFENLAIPYSTFIEDLGELIEKERMVAATTEANAGADEYFKKFHTYKEIMEYTKNLAENYPQLATFVPSIGTTLQNRSIFAIEFGANASAPVIIMNSAIHAREWITATSTQFFITQLLSGYGRDPVATDLLRTFRWKVVPILNPDGYDYTWSSNRMWRKNRHKVSSICTGIDNNRNWGFRWQASPWCDETYPGDKGFSELETQAMSNYISETEDAIAYIDVHSYSQLWMYPWGDISDPIPDKKDVDQVSRAAVEAIASVNGLKFKYGSIYNTIYAVSGGSIDWAYDKGVKYAFGLECRDTGEYGFVQPPEAIVPAGREMAAGFIAMAKEIKKIEAL